MTRAFRLTVHGRFYEAFSLNPLGALICILTILFVVYALSVVVFRLPRPRLKLDRSVIQMLLRLGLPAVLLLNWIYLFLNGV